MQPKSTLAVLLPAAFLFHSCASILNSKEQKMTLITDHEDNKVYVNDSLIGTGTTVLTKFKRDLTAKEVRIEREGQEDKTYAVIQTKKSPLYFFSVVPFGITFYAPFMDSHPKAFDYDKNQPVFTPGEEYVEQKEENKHIFINEATINIAKGDFTIKGIPYKNYKKGDLTPGAFATTNTNSQEMTAEGVGIQVILNEILNERGFMDTTETILKRKTNTLYIDVELTKFHNRNVYRSFINAGATSFLFAEMEFKWTLRDVYKQVLLEKTITTVTDQFRSYSFSYVRVNDDKTNPYERTVRNGLEKSLVEFLRLEEVQAFLPMDKDDELTDMYEIRKGAALTPSKLSETIKACATIKLKDKSHGSAFYINDNLLMTNYHVVAGQDTVDVVTNDGTKIKGIVVRKSELHDLAVIETKDYKSKFCIPLSRFSAAELGDEVYAIGTPSSIEFTQTLSKGIVSGRRTTEEVDLIQTDVSINPGNSGGPLVDSKGILIGVVNAKLIGNNVEGIGFGIPADKLVDYLKLKI